MNPGDAPKFMMDQMLITVGKYLRICGHDAEWDTGATRHELIVRANAEGRIFVTCTQRPLDEKPVPAKSLKLEVGDPVEQFHEIIRAFGLDTTGRLFTKCIRCNVALDDVADNEAIREKVHPNVFAQHSKFYRCPKCGTVFWRGSHVVNTCRKLGLSFPKDEPEAA